MFRTVTLPLCIPGLANAFLLLFGVARRLRDAADPRRQRVSGCADEAYLQITGLYDLRGGAALSFALLVPALAVFVLQRYWVSQRFM